MACSSKARQECDTVDPRTGQVQAVKTRRRGGCEQDSTYCVEVSGDRRHHLRIGESSRKSGAIYAWRLYVRVIWIGDPDISPKLQTADIGPAIRLFADVPNSGRILIKTGDRLMIGYYLVGAIAASLGFLAGCVMAASKIMNLNNRLDMVEENLRQQTEEVIDLLDEIHQIARELSNQNSGISSNKALARAKKTLERYSTM